MKSIFIIIFLFFYNFSLSQISNWKGTVEIKNNIPHIKNPKEGIWDKDHSKIISKERVLYLGSLDTEDEFIFSWVNDILTDSNGNIYACDTKEKRVQVYNKKGKYLYSIGRAGKGPGEFSRPKKLDIDSSGNLIVRDDLNFRISSFNSNGQFISSIQYQGFAGSSLEVNHNGNILLDVINAGQRKSPIVTVYNRYGKIINTYGNPILILEKDTRGKPYYSHSGFQMTQDSVLYVFFSYPYRIEIYSDGDLKRVIERESPIFKKPKIVESIYYPRDGKPGKSTMVKNRSYIWDIFFLPDGKFLTIIRDSGKDYENNNNVRQFSITLDLFNKEGHFLKTYPWDWEKHGLIKRIDAEGYLYTNIGESGIIPGVSKWRVSFE